MMSRMHERRVVYLVAVTADGFIAAEDGGIEAFVPDRAYLDELFSRFPETCPVHLREVFGVTAPNQRFDTVVMGRGTYELGLAAGVTDPYPTLRTVVVSTTLEARDPRVEVAAGDLPALVARLREQDGRDIWLAGGGKLAAAFRDHDLIDELVLKVNPITLGRGIPLFDGPASARTLELVGAEALPAGVQLVRYRA